MLQIGGSLRLQQKKEAVQVRHTQLNDAGNLDAQHTVTPPDKLLHLFQHSQHVAPHVQASIAGFSSLYDTAERMALAELVAQSVDAPHALSVKTLASRDCAVFFVVICLQKCRTDILYIYLDSRWGCTEKRVYILHANCTSSRHKSLCAGGNFAVDSCAGHVRI